ncbi:MAG: NADH:ubiquinone oxidoreductase subunit 5 (subunit L)/multisubunit Na+/H+ antiporter MnhA subunit [Myxococcota bacterium]|jgi:NADH:ubiquinone oxidoreductase subunit 5 (subunit L)/multisubunit Na+/H+ antiporter MnhA subunit
MQVSAGSLLPWIVCLPLLGAIVNALIGWRLQRKTVALIAVGSVGTSFLLSLRAFYALAHIRADGAMDPSISKTLYTWAVTGMFQFDVAFYMDPLSAVMLLIVTGVGTLIHIYSIGYMSEEPSVARYFAYLNLFMFSMLCLILGKNLLMLFVGWEGVGVCSYLLIGFWFSDDAKAQAGQKAFIVNRIGDVGFIIGMILVMYHAGGTTDYEVLKWRFQDAPFGPFFDPTTLNVACLLLFIGACGKSAQIPLYVWLPDAMAGPTPVSALIHAATMVTAGVYMIARLSFMYTLAPDAMYVVATVGGLTAIFAALMALTQRDIKGVLAYSTVSQLGYMVLAVGVGAYVAGVFHLMTHAFFKALLFLGAGSVIHGMSGKQDIMEMGGLKKKMPQTRITFLIACLAIAGVPPLSGFFSKDAILWEVHSRKQLLTVPQQARAAWSDGQTMLLGGKQGVLLEYSGDDWQRIDMPFTDMRRGTASQKVMPGLRDITVDDSGNGWAVSEYATIYKRTAGQWANVWQAEPKLMSRHLNGVWAASESDVWFVGERGLVVHFDGTDYSVKDAGTLATLHAVAGASANEVYLAGAGGTIVTWDGKAFSAVESTGTATVTGLAQHAGTVWGTTAQGAVIKVGKGGFEKVAVAAEVNLQSLVGLSSAGDDLLIAGAGVPTGESFVSPVVVRKTGDAWALSAGKSGKLQSVGVAGGTIYAAAEGQRVMTAVGSGKLERTDGLPSLPAHSWLWLLGAITAGLTAFYMFRLYFITFEGETRADAETWDNAHESPWVMTFPLWVLAIASAVAGLSGSALTEWLSPVFATADTRLVAVHEHTMIAYVPTLLGFIGIAIAYLWYRNGVGAAPKALAKAAPWAYRLSNNKFYVDELYARMVIGPYRFVADVLHRVVDVKIIDFGITGLTSMIVRAGGSVLRLFQNGDVQRYAVGIVVGLAAVIWLMGL